MADVKITDMTADSSVTGVELIPVSDAGSPKSVTVTALKQFVIDAIEAVTAGTAVTGSDSVFILQSGVMKPADIDLIAQHAIDTIWAKAANASPAVADTIPTKTSGGVEKTMTLTVLSELVRATIEASILDVSDLASASALSNSDYMLVTQGTTGKKVLLSAVVTKVMDGLLAYIQALSDVTVATDADSLLTIQGGALKEVTLAKIGELFDVDGYATIWVPADLMMPTSTNGADFGDADYNSNVMTHAVALFAGATANESAEFDLVMPENWDRGTIKAKVYWAPGHADANVDEYVSFALAAGALSNDDALDAALGASQSVADQVLSDNDLHITAATAALTVGGTPALGDLIHFKLTRDYDYAGEGGGGVAMDVDARVFGVLIQYAKSLAVSAW